MKSSPGLMWVNSVSPQSFKKNVWMNGAGKVVRDLRTVIKILINTLRSLLAVEWFYIRR